MISDKQLKILAFPYSKYDALIGDGAIRSGKTSLMTVAFIDWAMQNFNNQRFGICGKTVDSCSKNIIIPYIGMNYAKERYAIKWKRSEKLLEVRQGNRFNVFEIFGGKDESSFTLIQGRTLAGVLLDEVALMPQSFVNMALSRCSVDGSKMWFNCNPASPIHWFYTDWILQAKEKNALHLHFKLEDNPSLSERKIKQYNSMYSGVFYQRYILGEWVLAEGLVYDFSEKNITDYVPKSGTYYISIDYGTANPFSAGLWCVLGNKAIRVKEFYYNSRKEGSQLTDEEYCDRIEELAGGKEISEVIVDPSALSFITALERRNFYTRKANNDVLDGIRRTAVYLQNGNILIHRSCEDSIREFGLYRWDEKATMDHVIKENDHAMDEIRYFANTILRWEVEEDY